MRGLIRMRPIEAYFDSYFPNNGESMVAQTLRAEFETKMVNDFLLSEHEYRWQTESRCAFPLDNDLVNLR